MPRFEYRAQDAQGNTLAGIIEASTPQLATETLLDKGLTILTLQEAARKSILQLDLPFIGQVTTRDLVIFSRQFAVLMGAKVPVVAAIKTVGKQTKNDKLRAMLVDVADEVESGTALSMSMAKYPKAFSNFFVNMIRSGETTGRLEEVMNYLADQMERDFDLMTRIKGAMIYPIIVIFGLVIVGFVMLTFVVPKLTDVLKESGTTLPWTTNLLIATSDFFKRFAMQIIALVVVSVVGLRWWVSTDQGRQYWDSLILYVPVFGPMIQLIYLVRFTRSLATLLSGGVDVPASLEVCADIVGNARYKNRILATKKEVMDGNSITSIFEQDKLIPSMVPQMMAVGEETGRLFEVLEKLTDFYTRELQNRVDNLVHAIEPLIMLVMGGAVGIMVAAIIMPMYSMATNM
jgi:type IV pilus assembly protein PilC